MGYGESDCTMLCFKGRTSQWYQYLDIYLHDSIVWGHYVYRRVWSDSNSISVGRLLRRRPTGLFCTVVGELDFGLLPLSIDNCLFEGFAFIEERRAWHHSVITRWSITKLPDISTPAISHSSRTSTVRYNYITQKSWMRGCLKSCMQKN